jgi:hypothetical protein
MQNRIRGFIISPLLFSGTRDAGESSLCYRQYLSTVNGRNQIMPGRRLSALAP